METCIHLNQCYNLDCTEACNTWAESTYLQSRNNCKLSDYNYNTATEADIHNLVDKCMNSEKKFVWRCKTSIRYIKSVIAYLIDLTYPLNGHRCSVYNLKFGSYIEGVRRGIDSGNDSESIQYMSIWSESSDYLVISNMDYCFIGVVEYTRLMQLVENRASEGKYTFIFTNIPVTQMVGKPETLSLLQMRLEEVKIDVI